MSMQALAPRNGTAAAVVPYEAMDPESFVTPGMENVTPDELKLPILRLVQAQSKIDDKAGHEGEWHNSVTGEFTKRPEVLIIGVSRGRIMFPQEYNAENKALCASDNGQLPRAEFVGTSIETVITNPNTGRKSVSVTRIPSKCAECPFSQWGANSEPPACADVAVFAGVVEDGLPVLMQIKSAGMAAVPGLKTLIATNGIRRTIRAGSAHKTDNKGDYYVPVFTPGDKPSWEWQQNAMRLARLGNMAARNQAAAMEDSAPAGGDNGGTADDGGYAPDANYDDSEALPF